MRHTILDALGSISSSVSTVGYVIEKAWAWPVGLIAICINLVLYWRVGLYGDVGLHVLYLVMTFYGWYQWLYGSARHTPIVISHVPLKTAILLSILGVAGIFLVHLGLLDWTNSKVPYWDAVTTVLSVIAQWMICKKYIENWIVWFVADGMYVGLYAYKGLPAHTIEMSVYVLAAVVGYVLWYRKLSTQ